MIMDLSGDKNLTTSLWWHAVDTSPDSG
jgi:hypothetical protein